MCLGAYDRVLLVKISKQFLFLSEFSHKVTGYFLQYFLIFSRKIGCHGNKIYKKTLFLVVLVIAFQKHKVITKFYQLLPNNKAHTSLKPKITRKLVKFLILRF